MEDKLNRVIIFGGTFDPIHYAHLIIAQDILEKIETKTILFLPTLKPPHKKSFASFLDRLNMVNLAISGNPEFQCSDIEKSLPKPSYTINTLRAIKKKLKSINISFIIGMDSAVEFDTWKEPENLLKEFEIIVLPRPCFKGEEVLPRFKEEMKFLNTRMIEISSSEIRKRIREGKKIKYLTPNSVIDYIRKKGLYK